MTSLLEDPADDIEEADEDVDPPVELDPLAELDAALTRYISRYGYYRLNRRDSDEIGPERQRSAIAILASLKSRDHLSVLPFSTQPSRRLQGRGAFSQNDREPGQLTDAEYESFMGDLVEETSEIVARTRATLTEKARRHRKSRSQKLEHNGSSEDSESGSTSWDGSSARGDEEEINITLQCHSDREHIGDDGDCGMRLDWKRYLPKVESVVEGGIAFGCGIRGRDEIIRINAIDVRLVGEARFRDMLKFLPVTLTIRRLKCVSVSDPHPNGDPQDRGSTGAYSPDFEKLLEELRSVLPPPSIDAFKDRISVIHDHLNALHNELAGVTESMHDLYRDLREEVLVEIRRLQDDAKNVIVGDPSTNKPGEESPPLDKASTHTVRVQKGKITINKKDLDEALRRDSTANDSHDENDFYYIASCSYEPPLITDV